ncbi:hypothetical protein DOK76_09800 [Vagococcus sp. DIV0080]|uniref:YokE-like PH domain-containing protein n=1 Tax=Candidatus Vagococcus giribetii TaxID=2230876 RepID=A0ABS3HUE3_9ENTE|nr:hypothetical protein [Vagococcus sp. DIV0080]MBO0477367.1 hypothetical protein [Vagococcus sp. DIV0080]
MFISKETIHTLSLAYLTEHSVVCYAESQSLAITTNKVILIMDHSQLYILGLNTFLTKVTQVTTLSLTDITNERFSTNPLSLSVTWSFTSRTNEWHFRIMKKILTLGDGQKEFINRLNFR